MGAVMRAWCLAPALLLLLLPPVALAATPWAGGAQAAQEAYFGAFVFPAMPCFPWPRPKSAPLQLCNTCTNPSFAHTSLPPLIPRRQGADRRRARRRAPAVAPRPRAR